MNIPQQWLAALDRLQKMNFPEAFIGGGALRDLDNGKDVKDIDIFLRQRPGPMLAMIGQPMGMKWPEDLTEFHTEYQTFNAEVVGVYSVDDPQTGDLYNVIACNGPTDPDEFMQHHLQRFDLGLCRLGDNGRYTSILPEYGADKTNKTLTIVNPVNLERSIERAKRIRHRAYQDHTIILPDGTPFTADEFNFD